MLSKLISNNNEGFALIAILFLVTITILIGTGVLYLSFKNLQALNNLKGIISEYL